MDLVCSILLVLGIALGLTGDYTSDSIAIPLMPATWAFSVWLLIYAQAIRLTAFVWQGQCQRLEFWPGLAFFLSGLWSRVDQLHSLVLSSVLMFFTLVSALRSLHRLHEYDLKPEEWANAARPLSLFAGWISLAVGVNFTQILVRAKWLDSDCIFWSEGVLLACLVSALFLRRFWGLSRSFTLVVAWGSLAVGLEQLQSFPLIGVTGILGAATLAYLEQPGPGPSGQ